MRIITSNLESAIGRYHRPAVGLTTVRYRDSEIVALTETKKDAEASFFNDLQTSMEPCKSIFGAGNESCTRALSLCFPITFSTVVISEELNYSLVFRPRQQSSSNHFHQRPRMIHPPVVTPDASSC